MSGSSSGVLVPPGQYPPFAVVTDTDHTAWIIIATSLGLCWILLFAGIRVFIRSSISRGLEFDEYAIAASTILAIIQSSLILAACADGLGKSIELLSPDAQNKIQRMYYASNLFFVLSLGLSKLSVGFFLLRLTSVRLHKLIFTAVMAFIAAWTVAAIFTVALQCDLSHPWFTIGEICANSSLRVQVLGAFDIITELLLFGMAVLLVWDLKTSMRNKVLVMSAFVFRLIMIIATAFRIANFDATGYTTDPTIREDLYIVWTQTELDYSLIAATIPILRPFMHNLNSQFGGMGKTSNGYGYGYGYEHSSNKGYQLSNLKSADKSRSRNEVDPLKSTSALDPQPHDYNYEIWAPNENNGQPPVERKPAKPDAPKDEANGDATSVGSNDSQRLIIRKDVTFQVRYDSNVN